ncbi:flavodoxin family protein [Frigidibacter oleivorans]|uniref:flavodoxin family protein n=1 Tax=Frigidibacter oleivorans TaxID=2487129 RepID=UPI000F8C6D87|nr:NAD(P)H-dependent oxidoreductase [Frigidibacter oleivorans]
MPDQGLTAHALSCSLRRTGAGEPSSSEKMVEDIFAALARHGVATGHDRVADFDVKPGVGSDEGPGDDWPALRRRVLAADIFVLALPIWMGQPSSIAKRVLERMDAFLGEADDRQRMPPLGKVALVAVVGNEDGAHACHAACFQALSDVGFTIPPNAGIYWVGEAMGRVNYVDLPEPPDNVASAIELAVSNAVALARALKAHPYPGV